MSTVKLPSVLRQHANGEREIDVEGGTVGDAVQALVGRHPALAEQLLTPEGELHRFVNVYVNGRDVRYLEGLATPVAERDEIRLLPAIAGGSPAPWPHAAAASGRAVLDSDRGMSDLGRSVQKQTTSRPEGHEGGPFLDGRSIP